MKIKNFDDSRQITKLLWTGGWDSTFRLLQVLLLNKEIVQPYYIKFRVRKSTKKEIAVMNRLREEIYKSYPFTKKLMLDTIYINDHEIQSDSEITSIYKKLTEENYIGNQYDYIVRFAKQYMLEGLEIGTEGSGNTHNFVKPHVSTENKHIKIDRKKAPEHIYQFYKYFHFPLLNYSKSEMGKIADKNNWSRILDDIWICHKPLFGKIPCGACNPCINAAKDEFTKHRIPAVNRYFGKYIKTLYNSKLIKILRK